MPDSGSGFPHNKNQLAEREHPPFGGDKKELRMNIIAHAEKNVNGNFSNPAVYCYYGRVV